MKCRRNESLKVDVIKKINHRFQSTNIQNYFCFIKTRRNENHKKHI